MIDPNIIDRHVARRIALRRANLEMSQRQAADAIGVSLVSYQKYESGNQRLDFIRLIDIAEAFNVPVSFFYDDVPVRKADHITEAAQQFNSIADDTLRRIILRLVERLAARHV